MIPVILLLLQTAPAQTDNLMRGAKVFAQSCAVGYCHGSGGAANRGPRLAGRGFDRGYVDKVTREGIPGTAMPPFKTLPAADLEAVIGYVFNISGGVNSGPAVPVGFPSPEPPQFPGPPEAKKGKDLFFEAARGGNRCATCHAVEGWGIAVGPNLVAKPPQSAAAIRQAKSPNVRLAVAGTERFPAMVVSRRPDTLQVYDMGAVPPVLRTFTGSEVKLEDGGSWSHGEAIRGYTDAQLASIVAYLRWLAAR